MRRVAISLLGYEPVRLGGAGVYTEGLVRALVRRRRHEYVLLTHRAHEQHWRMLTEDRARIVACGLGLSSRVLRVLYEQTRLARVARGLGADLVFFPLAVAPWFRNPPAVVTLYDLLLLSQPTDFAWHKRMYLDWTYRRLARAAAHILTISEFSRVDACRRLRLAPDRVTVAPPGLDEELLSQSQPTVTDRERVPYVLSVAGAYPHKRLDVVLDAFAVVASDRPDLTLILAGTHTGTPGGINAVHEAVLAKRLEGRVRFVPPIERAQLAELFRDALAYVSASTFEGFGIPIAEALAAGCPVAASPAGAVAEVVGEYGFLASDFTSGELARALLQAISARANAPERLAAGRAHARARYAWDSTAAVVEVVFRDACV